MSCCVSVFKNSEQVTLLGRTSGGGSCVVLPMSTAYGSLFRISGPNRLAFTKNGSFYDIDQGAEPDFTLAFPETLYDRRTISTTCTDRKANNGGGSTPQEPPPIFMMSAAACRFYSGRTRLCSAFSSARHS